MTIKNYFKGLAISTQLWIAGVILIVSFGIIIFSFFGTTKRVIESQSQVIHTYEVLNQLESIEIQLLNLETGQRGFLITGEETYLEPFNISLSSIYSSLESLRINTIDNPDQTAKIDKLKGVVDQKIEELNLTIFLRRTQGYEEARTIVENNSGKSYMDEIRIIMEDLRSEEYRLLGLRSPLPLEFIQDNQKILLSLLASIVVIIAIVFILIRNSITGSIKKLQHATDEIGRGNLDYSIDFNLQTELGKLGKSLDSMRLQIQKYLTTNKVLEMEIIEKSGRQKKLEETKDSLEEKNRELEEFNQIASHDLQQPLNSIIGFSHILEGQKDQLDTKGQKSVDHINGSAKRMKSYIQSLLDYANIGSEAKRTTVDIQNLIGRVEFLLKDEITKKNAALIYLGGPIDVHGFEADLMMLFQNLIGNALKYAKEDQAPVITIKTKKKSDKYLFSINDNGIGIPKNDFEKVFKIFTRLHANNSPYKGTGVGLASVKRIIEMHKGEIWIESELDEGTTFYFTLPQAFSELV
jgi:signal transduction histidine kinase